MAKDLEFIQRGKVLIVRRQFQEAVRVCRLGLLANPTLVEGRLVLGMALMALGRYDDVLAEMRVALEIDAANPLATLLKGEALFYKGDHEQAEEVLVRAQELDPQSEKAQKLVTEIRLAREAGLSPERPREVTDTKVYPAVAEGVEVSGPKDLPEALPPPEPSGPAQVEPSAPKNDFQEERTEVDPKPAGAQVDLPTPELVPGRRAPARTEEPGLEETPTTMPWVGADKVEDTTESESTPIKQPEIPAQARRPQPTLLGIPSSVVVVPAVGKRPLPSPDGYEDTGQGDDYMDTTGGGRGSAGPSAPLIPRPRDDVEVSGVSSVDTTATTTPSSQSITLEETTEPTAPETPHAVVGAQQPSVEPSRPRPPSAAPAPPVQVSADFEEASTVSRDTLPRPPDPLLIELPLGASVRPVETPEAPTAPRSAALAQPQRATKAPSGPRLPSAPKPSSAPKPAVTDKIPPSLEARSSQRSHRTVPVWTGQWRLVLTVSAAVVVVSIGLGFAIRAWRGRSEAARRREQAQKQIATGNLQGYVWAQRAYDQVLSAYPTDLDAMAGRALVLAASWYEFDEPEREAHAALEAARKRAGTRPVPTLAAASVYLGLAGGRAEAAEKEARAAAARFDNDALSAYLVGRAELLRGNAAAAQVSFTDALKRDRHSILALYGLGLAHAMLGDADEALRAYERALSENANHIATMVARSRLRVARGRDLMDAENDLVAVVEKLRQQASRAQVAWAQLSLAELYGSRGDVLRARAALEEARRGGSDKNAQFWESAAHAALQVYDIAGARKDAQKAVELAPTAPGPHMALAAALLEYGEAQAALNELVGTAARDTPDYLTLRGRARLAIGRAEGAKDDLQQAAARVPDLPDVELLRARIDLHDHEPARAIEALRKLADRFPGRADVVELLGLALAERKDTAAKKTLERAAALNPNAVDARVALAHILHREGKTAEAAKRVQEAIEVRPTAIGQRELGQLLFESGDLVGAQKAFELARQSGPPDDPQLLMASARVAAAAADQPTAERLVTQAVARGASKYSGWKVRARAALAAGRPKDALRWARLAAGANIDDADAVSLLAQAVAGTGRRGQARVYLHDALKRLGGRPDLLYALAKIDLDLEGPELLRLAARVARAYRAAKRPPRVISEAYTMLGKAYYGEGEIGRAGAALDQALQFNPHNAMANYQKGILVSEREQTDEAQKLFEAAAEYLPRVPLAYYELGKLRKKTGDRAGAKKAYEAYLKLAPEGDYADEVRRELESLKAG